MENGTTSKPYRRYLGPWSMSERLDRLGEEGKKEFWRRARELEEQSEEEGWFFYPSNFMFLIEEMEKPLGLTGYVDYPEPEKYKMEHSSED